MQTRHLPLFPLPLVLFPGETRGLHIFEPRYRQLLADCRQGDDRFGITPVLPQEPPTPLQGAVGCVGRIERVMPHPDGRSDIQVVGEERFTIDTLAETDRLYLVGIVTALDDAPTGDLDQLLASAETVRQALVTYLEAVSRLTEQMVPTMLPEDPFELSFAAAAILGVDLPTKVRWLRLRSTRERLHEIADVLERGTQAVLDQVNMQQRSKRNGKRPSGQDRGDGT